MVVSVEEYLNTDWVPRCEYIDGVLRPKALGTIAHGKMETKLVKAIEVRGWDAAPELTLYVTPTKFLVLDVGADRNKLEGEYPRKPIALCIEVLSPGDRVNAVLAKCEEYHDWGVPCCWVVDPETPRAWIYERGAAPAEVSPGGMLHAGELQIQLDELY